MFDIGWGELFLIGIVALIVVGPKELPGLFRTVGVLTGKARAMARDFQRTLEQAADESGMSEVSKSLKSLERINLNSPGEAARTYATRAATGAAAGAATAGAPAGATEKAAATSAPGPMAPEAIGTPATPEAASPEAPAEAAQATRAPDEVTKAS